MLILLSFFIQLCASLKTIRVYADSGASDGSVSSIISTFNVLLPSSEYRITRIFAPEILSNEWLDTSLLVFPGGMDLPYVAALNLKGYEIIRRYIDSGGNYLGVCAGMLI